MDITFFNYFAPKTQYAIAAWNSPRLVDAEPTDHSFANQGEILEMQRSRAAGPSLTVLKEVAG